MKNYIVFLLVISFAFASFRNKDDSEIVTVPAAEQRTGDAQKGYEYLITGDYLKSGVAYDYFILKAGKNHSNYLNRIGKNATVSHVYNVVKNKGVDVVVPTCLQCHSQVMDGKLIIGLGNTFLNFTNGKQYNGTKFGLGMMKMATPNQYKAGKNFFRSFYTVYPKMETEVRGVNTADRLAMLLVAHRDPKTLEWSKKLMLNIPDEVVPTDVPAWWLMKKKNAIFYTGFGRGDFTRFLMLSNILTVQDTSEAREVSNHFGDVLAYIRSLSPPKYPLPIDEDVAGEGKTIFNQHCAGCHGTYGEDGVYPNRLVPAAIIQTDSMLYKSNQQYSQFLDWFSNSWFAKGDLPTMLVPFKGYIAPPLDGIWITAPYLHNGSVPTLEAVLNSKKRPKYWIRSFNSSDYDYKIPGWRYAIENAPDGKKVYNTTLPGYGNYGHYFGDKLSNEERTAVIEYLKTL